MAKSVVAYHRKRMAAMSVSQLAEKLFDEPDEAPKYGLNESEVTGLEVKEIEELIDECVDAASQAPFMTSKSRLLYKTLGYRY